jgi:hypothetical protein
MSVAVHQTRCCSAFLDVELHLRPSSEFFELPEHQLHALGRSRDKDDIVSIGLNREPNSIFHFLWSDERAQGRQTSSWSTSSLINRSFSSLASSRRPCSIFVMGDAH